MSESAVLTTRRADADDTKGLNALVNNVGGATILKATFGPFNFQTMLENTHLTVVADANNKGETETVGCFCVNDSISLSGDAASFEDILNALNYYLPVTVNNALFLNFWLLDENMDRLLNTGYELIREAFSICHSVDFLIWLCPATYITSEFVDRNFGEIQPEFPEGSSDPIGIPKGFKILYLHRSNFLPRLMVRPARVEDNDDLIPILQHSNPDILVGQDDFFLADLIQAQDSRNHFFVGVKEREIVGMLATSLDVNVTLLLKIFDFDSFPDIIISKEETPRPPPLVIAVVGDLRLVDASSIERTLGGKNCIFVSPGALLGSVSGDSADDLDNTEDDLPKDETKRSLREMIFESIGPKKTSNVEPDAYVLFGFPRNENEAYEQLNQVLTMDYIIELENIAEEDEEEDDDDALQQHLDALEVLKETLLGGDGRDESKSGELMNAPKWCKVSIEGNGESGIENAHYFNLELDKILDQRAQVIEYQRMKDDEEPPQANAFALTVFCFEEGFSSRGNDLLKIAFEEHPEQDYCLYMVANNKPHPAETKTMTFVATRPGLSFDQSLYIMHKSAFLAQQHLKIERLDMGSLPILRKFVSTLREEDEKAEVLADIERVTFEHNDEELKDNPPEVCFVAKIGEAAIAVVQLSRRHVTNDDVNWYRANYNIDHMLNFELYRTKSQALITRWLIDPIYSKFSRFIVREVMRQYGKTLLYYHPLPTAEAPKEILEEFVHASPRRRQQGVEGDTPMELLERFGDETKQQRDRRMSMNLMKASTASMEGGGPALLTDREQPGNDSPLYLLMKKSLSQSKVIVAKRLVVIGGSSHALAYLDALLSIPHLFFPNVFLVVDHLFAPFRVAQGQGQDAAAVGLWGESASSAPGSLGQEESKHDEDYSGCLSPADVSFPIEQVLFAMGLAHKVTLIKGKLTDIDRENKAVVISDELVVEYDLLLLSASTQDNTTRMLPSLAGTHPTKCAQAGIFELGNPVADLRALKWAAKAPGSRPDSIVIYGGALRVLTACGRLMQRGIHPDRIRAVVKEPVYFDELDNMQIHRRIYDGIEASGLQVLWGHQVNDVVLGTNGTIQGAVVQIRKRPEQPNETPMLGVEALRQAAEREEAQERAMEAGEAKTGELAGQRRSGQAGAQESKGSQGSQGDADSIPDDSAGPPPMYMLDPEELPCMALLCCLDQACDKDVFSAVNDCGLVFDGGLVVDKNFCTVDPSIYAVGDFTRFSSRIKEALPHQRYNPVELGSFVAMKMLKQHLDPMVPDDMDRSSLEMMTLGPHTAPKFTLPRSLLSQLPGGLHFFLSRLPRTALNVRSLLTEKTQGTPPSSRTVLLKVGALGVVQEVAYVGSDSIEERNLSCLPGKHESLLNSAVYEHEKKHGAVTDWIAFFRGKWADALYHDRFPALLVALRTSLKEDKGTTQVLNRVYEYAHDNLEDLPVDASRRRFIGVHGTAVPESARSTSESGCVDFLRRNKTTLARYQMPGQKPSSG